MAKTICQLKEAIQLITINTDRLLFANKKIMQLEQEVFHERGHFGIVGGKHTASAGVRILSKHVPSSDFSHPPETQ